MSGRRFFFGFGIFSVYKFSLQLMKIQTTIKVHFKLSAIEQRQSFIIRTDFCFVSSLCATGFRFVKFLTDVSPQKRDVEWGTIIPLLFSSKPLRRNFPCRTVKLSFHFSFHWRVVMMWKTNLIQCDLFYS